MDYYNQSINQSTINNKFYSIKYETNCNFQDSSIDNFNMTFNNLNKSTNYQSYMQYNDLKQDSSSLNRTHY